MPLYIHLFVIALNDLLLAITPLILLVLAAGVFASIIQGAIQIEDGTFSLIPKLLAGLIGLILMGGFMLNIEKILMSGWIKAIPHLIRLSWW